MLYSILTSYRPTSLEHLTARCLHHVSAASPGFGVHSLCLRWGCRVSQWLPFRNVTCQYVSMTRADFTFTSNTWDVASPQMTNNNLELHLSRSCKSYNIYKYVHCTWHIDRLIDFDYLFQVVLVSSIQSRLFCYSPFYTCQNYLFYFIWNLPIDLPIFLSICLSLSLLRIRIYIYIQYYVVIYLSIWS